MDDWDNAILQHMLKLTDGKTITKKDREIYNIALMEKFKQAFPEQAASLRVKK